MISSEQLYKMIQHLMTVAYVTWGFLNIVFWTSNLHKIEQMILTHIFTTLLPIAQIKHQAAFTWCVFLCGGS